ncbi:MAG: DNA topoisomerase IV subunit A [Alphaproteobacteria bacterium]|nr:DNA topoisomerase IV subunit A [Alphaproteobacteria bacterium]
MAKVLTTGDIRPTPFPDALSSRYLAYALSTITARSLPDVRDGLKPVHRRLLYAMRQLKLDPSTGFKKCARIVGDVIGKYHPHGDQAVYDALVRLAQSFAARYPLVDGQGNFGNVDGDNAAAMRYTEARMTTVAEALLAQIDEATVDFRPNYDGEDEEPIVLPARFPNLLANGATGIAVGMATSIPPHNVGEICQALLHLIKFPNARAQTLVEFMPGPDFPTGGVVVEPTASIVEAYATGRGSFRLRARWAVEKLGHGQYQIVVTEIPYQVAKSRLIERIATMIQEKKLPGLADVRDESAEDIRIVLEPKSRAIDPDALMETLFRASDLEVRVSLNMNVLDAKHTPKVMNLRDVLQAFLDHRNEVLLRRSRYRLQVIADRLEILVGYLIAYLNLDAIIKIIRNEDEPKPILMKRFKLTDRQAEAILNMRLRSLRRLEEKEIKAEHDALSLEQVELNKLVKDKKRQWAAIGDEIKDIDKKFGAKTPLGKRRTDFGAAPAAEEVPLQILVEREPITVICSEKGWIRALKGHVDEVGADVKYKEGDRGRFWLKAQTTDKICLFATNGRFYTFAGDKLPSGRGHGEPIRLMIDLGNDEDIVALFVHQPGQKRVVAASDGRGFVVLEDEVIAQTRSGKRALNVKEGGAARACKPLVGDSIAVVGENRKLVIFPAAELPEMARGRGVRLQRYKEGGLSDLKTFDRAQGLSWSLGDKARVETDLGPWLTARGKAGRLPPKGFPKSNRFDG